MTPSLTPGPTMDALIARQIWRAVVVMEPQDGTTYLISQETRERMQLPRYSTRMKDTILLVRQMHSRGFISRVQAEGDEYRACFLKDDGNTYTFETASTMSMAICLAALAAVSGTNVARE